MVLRGVVSRIAICSNCGWRSEDVEKANGEARKHALANNHVVSVEVATNYIYGVKKSSA